MGIGVTVRCHSRFISSGANLGAPMLPPPPPYTIQSHATFYTRRSGERVCFRSLLEARWAWAFERLGFEWEYEPRTFLLPSGAVYTPDF